MRKRDIKQALQEELIAAGSDIEVQPTGMKILSNPIILVILALIMALLEGSVFI